MVREVDMGYEGNSLSCNGGAYLIVFLVKKDFDYASRIRKGKIDGL